MKYVSLQLTPLSLTRWALMKGTKCVKSLEQWVLDFHSKAKVFPDLSLLISFMKKSLFQVGFFSFIVSPK